MTQARNRQMYPMNIIFEAYRLGGFPLVLVICGIVVLSAGTVLDGYFDIVPSIDPPFVLIAGILLMLLGTTVWAIEVAQFYRTQVLVAEIIISLIDGAGRSSSDGDEYINALNTALNAIPGISRIIRINEPQENEAVRHD